MESKMKSFNMALAQIYKREDELYHRYATFCGLSDPAIWVLYALYEEEDKIYTQNDLVSMWYYPKQTVNYTVSCLVKNNWVKLEQLPGARNSKAVRLTEEGKQICVEKILPLMKAEEHSLKRMTETERTLLLQLTETQCTYFEEELKKIMEEQN